MESYVGMLRVSLKLNRYRSRGYLKAKAYVPAKLSSIFKGVDGVEWNGARYPACIAPSSKKSRSLKIHIPQKILNVIGDYKYILVEVSEKSISIISGVNRCRICCEETASLDGICFKKHFEDDGRCMRCGKKIRSSSLCGDCLEVYSKSLFSSST
ncbi:MAG: hypothetical protein QXP57_08515 [Nitrososphaerota archaeon]